MQEKKLAVHPIQLLDVIVSEVNAKVLKDEVPKDQPKLNIDIATRSSMNSWIK